ncbi:MAG: TolB family protein [Planctomycetota bacterium]
MTNVLQNSEVERGRLRGDDLSSGTFLSPELSYDGKTILFAYTQAKAYDKYRGKEAYEWGPEISYHIFKVNVDGTGLVQLTDGPWDDFDPAFLPNGRIVFISERRGGYLRCGRHCPVYTMYSMEPDGSDIICEQRWDACLQPLGLCRPRHEHRAPHLDQFPGRSQSTFVSRQLSCQT